MCLRPLYTFLWPGLTRLGYKDAYMGCYLYISFRKLFIDYDLMLLSVTFKCTTAKMNVYRSFILLGQLVFLSFFIRSKALASLPVDAYNHIFFMPP
jgi:hypothetical protein